MQINEKRLSDTKVSLACSADADQLQELKQKIVAELAKGVSVAGFRAGKAPAAVAEKHIDPRKLQTEFLERAVNALYSEALGEKKLRPVAQPEVKIEKFVPFGQLEFSAEVEVVGEITLPDYKKFKLAKPDVTVSAKEVDEVIKQLQQREAERKEVKRSSKEGDQVWIDFKGVDAKTGEPIKGADGKDYPLMLGSNTFIPGFEEHLIGLKPGQSKEFTITFPKDYGVKALQNRKVTFNVSVTKVQEVVEPELDDKLAAKVGPFKSVAELKEDVKKELKHRKQHEADRSFADSLVTKITDETKVAIPQALIDEQLERNLQDERQNLAYRGQNWEEFLKAEGVTEDEYKEKMRPAAEFKVKAGLALSEIAEKEDVQITKDELDQQLSSLKQQYPDPKMREQLNKPEVRRSVASRLITEKTLTKLAGYATPQS